MQTKSICSGSLHIKANYSCVSNPLSIDLRVSVFWTTHREMRANRAKLGKRHRHANEIEAKQLDALERETESQYSRLPLSSLKLLTSNNVRIRSRNFETISEISLTKKRVAIAIFPVVCNRNCYYKKRLFFEKIILFISF